MENFVLVGIVKNSDGKVLIVKRKKIEKSEDGALLTWVFPGGRQKIGETREEALEREILEETGYKVKAIRQISIRIHPQFLKIICYYLCELENEEQIQNPQEDEEIEEIKWVYPNELKNYFTTDIDPNVMKELGID
ncbi:MAG: NUDIX hydrolase [Minisyncoccia bacterium]